MSLFRRLRQALQGRPNQPVLEFRHERLGPWKRDENHWTVAVKHRDTDVSFRLGGTDGPDPRLLEHALEIVEGMDSFQDRVRAFLLEEARRHDPRVAEEIVQLQLDEVCLFWPDRPDDGMLYFSGPDEFRLWRCDYLERQPRQLGFDS